jgi:hypothetical protein
MKSLTPARRGRQGRLDPLLAAAGSELPGLIDIARRGRGSGGPMRHSVHLGPPSWPPSVSAAPRPRGSSRRDPPRLLSLSLFHPPTFGTQRAAGRSTGSLDRVEPRVLRLKLGCIRSVSQARDLRSRPAWCSASARDRVDHSLRGIPDPVGEGHGARGVLLGPGTFPASALAHSGCRNSRGIQAAVVRISTRPASAREPRSAGPGRAGGRRPRSAARPGRLR